ncbi:DEAD/DEAH box helicase [Alkalitalea saponilacus]|uniref:Superfamily II DNA and RNA helicase n=1 Tax=Alkalitalea saponilacus TaxID=889453 RepID=A0A1T5HLC2_9BACT|nr:DEAD/DEAH box helicase [Alkalitalea saponilacus]ASB47802.1 ATP-dependent RNA helicase [Alkalitalea saponilacus]SKC21351.1 Superfamily II DNA and RNA helicase [Alkalitalea saponilacus]
MKFTEFGFNAEILEGLEAMRFEEATPVQQETIPVIMTGNDIIACAQTGTGKTAAYLLPVLNELIETKDTTTTTLILVPTRELAIQIDQQMQGFSYFLPVTSVAVYGGNDAGLWDQQRKALTTGANVVVATPGRLIQHLTMEYFKFSNLKHLILDEADRMLDMGFHDDIMQIVKSMPQKRQTLLFSATMPPKIRELSRKLLSNPKEVSIAISKPAEGILQAAYLVYDTQKIPLINSLLKDKEMNSVIIFSSTKLKVKEIHRALLKEGFAAEAIHSDLEQAEREKVMLGFRNRRVKILVATDIIARGIDVDGIDLVINYDVPGDAEDYVHRVGRTARAKSTGVALTFINDMEQEKFSYIEKLIEKEIFKSPLPDGFEQGPEYNPDAPPRKRFFKKGHPPKKKFNKGKRPGNRAQMG